MASGVKLRGLTLNFGQLSSCLCWLFICIHLQSVGCGLLLHTPNGTIEVETDNGSASGDISKFSNFVLLRIHVFDWCIRLVFTCYSCPHTGLLAVMVLNAVGTLPVSSSLQVYGFCGINHIRLYEKFNMWQRSVCQPHQWLFDHGKNHVVGVLVTKQQQQQQGWSWFGLNVLSFSLF